MTKERGLSSLSLRLTEGVVRAAGQELDARDINDFGNALSDIEQSRKAVQAIEKFNLWELKVATDTLLILDPKGERYKALIDLLQAKLEEAVKLVPSNGENSNLIPREFLVKDFLKAHGIVPARCAGGNSNWWDFETVEAQDEYGLVLQDRQMIERKKWFLKIAAVRVVEVRIGKIYLFVKDPRNWQIHYKDKWRIGVFGRNNLQSLAILGEDVSKEFDVPVVVELEREGEYRQTYEYAKSKLMNLFI